MQEAWDAIRKTTILYGVGLFFLLPILCCCMFLCCAPCAIVHCCKPPKKPKRRGGYVAVDARDYDGGFGTTQRYYDGTGANSPAYAGGMPSHAQLQNNQAY